MTGDAAESSLSVWPMHRYPESWPSCRSACSRIVCTDAEQPAARGRPCSPRRQRRSPDTGLIVQRRKGPGVEGDAANRKLLGGRGEPVVHPRLFVGVAVDEQHRRAAAPEDGGDSRQQRIEDALEVRRAQQQAVDFRESFERGELLLQLSRHRIEGSRQVAEFIVTARLDECGKVPARHSLRRVIELLQGAHLATDDGDGKHADQHEGQQDDRRKRHFHVAAEADQRVAGLPRNHPPGGRRKAAAEEQLPRPGEPVLLDVRDLRDGCRVRRQVDPVIGESQRFVVVVHDQQVGVAGVVPGIGPQPGGLKLRLEPRAARQLADEVDLARAELIDRGLDRGVAALHGEALPVIQFRERPLGDGWNRADRGAARTADPVQLCDFFLHGLVGCAARSRQHPQHVVRAAQAPEQRLAITARRGVEVLFLVVCQLRIELRGEEERGHRQWQQRAEHEEADDPAAESALQIRELQRPHH